jgi:glycerol-3-phosphate dehydrogenase
MEPALTRDLIAAYSVKDASIDPFGLVIDNVAEAMSKGSGLLLNTPVEGLEVKGGRISAALLYNRFTGRRYRVEADVVVNASGVWAREVAALAGVTIDMQYSKGSLIIANTRLTRRVMNRLRPASDGDILVPGGTVSVIGTTSVHVGSLEDIHPEVSEADCIIDNAAEMIPALETTRYIRAYAGVRPLAGSGARQDDRDVSRCFALLDHEQCGIDNFITITGGKLTTFRLMAERASDLVCRKISVDRPCLTATIPLVPSDAGRWTRPAQAPLGWMQARRQNDPMLCECEMVSRHTVLSLRKHIETQSGKMGLKAVGLRSRVGKGTCQGAFCSVRIVGQLYDDRLFEGAEGVLDLIGFLGSRWKGMRPVLWDATLIQEELQESLHCGLFSLEMPEWKENRAS